MQDILGKKELEKKEYKTFRQKYRCNPKTCHPCCPRVALVFLSKCLVFFLLFFFSSLVYKQVGNKKIIMHTCTYYSCAISSTTCVYYLGIVTY